MSSLRVRTGFTIVELLVVTGILATLFALVLGGAKPGTNGQIKQAAQSVASVLLATQSRAIGNPAGAAVIFESSGLSCISVSNADVPPFILADTGTLTVTTGTTATVSVTTRNTDSIELKNGYRILFFRDQPPIQPPSGWMAFDCPAPPAATVSLRAPGGQTNKNTIWPIPTGGNSFAAQIARYPSKGETAYQIPKAAAIDLRYSGVGEDATAIWGGSAYATTWGGLANKGAIAIGFDSIGGIDTVMQQVLSTASSRTNQPFTPCSPIYILVASRSDIEANANTLASDQALWVAIHPQTGRASISSNVAQTGTDATSLRAARAKARAMMAIGK